MYSTSAFWYISFLPSFHFCGILIRNHLVFHLAILSSKWKFLHTSRPTWKVLALPKQSCLSPFLGCLLVILQISMCQFLRKTYPDSSEQVKVFRKFLQQMKCYNWIVYISNKWYTKLESCSVNVTIFYFDLYFWKLLFI